MDAMTIHVCLETPGAPSPEGEHQPDERWVCSCGDHFVWREGFNRGGHMQFAWWPAPAIPAPRGSRTARRGLLFGPRKG